MKRSIKITVVFLLCTLCVLFAAAPLMAGAAYKTINVKNTLDRYAMVIIYSEFDAPGYGTDRTDLEIEAGSTSSVTFAWHYHPTKISVWYDNRWQIDYSFTVAEQVMESSSWEIRRDAGGVYRLVRT